MLKRLMLVLVLLAVGAFTLVPGGCQKTEEEKAQETMEKAAEKAKEAGEEATEKTGGALKSLGDKAKEATD